MPKSIPPMKFFHYVTIVDIEESQAFPAAQGRALVARFSNSWRPNADAGDNMKTCKWQEV